jgi:hypothetical protein
MVLMKWLLNLIQKPKHLMSKVFIVINLLDPKTSPITGKTKRISVEKV